MDKDFESEVLTRLARIETKLDDYDNLKTKVEETRAKAYSNERRINELEDNNKWLSRTVAGAVIASLVGIITSVIQLAVRL